MSNSVFVGVVVLAALIALSIFSAQADPRHAYRSHEGEEIVWPEDAECAPIVSGYDSWIEADGRTRRDGSHDANDFVGRDTVLASGKGRVLEVYTDKKGGRNLLIEYDLPSPHLTYHLLVALTHLEPGSIKVKKGDTVQAGSVLARSGNSGLSSRYRSYPHLHLEVYISKEGRYERNARGALHFFDAHWVDMLDHLAWSPFDNKNEPKTMPYFVADGAGGYKKVGHFIQGLAHPFPCTPLSE